MRQVILLICDSQETPFWGGRSKEQGDHCNVYPFVTILPVEKDFEELIYGTQGGHDAVNMDPFGGHHACLSQATTTYLGGALLCDSIQHVGSLLMELMELCSGISTINQSA